MFHFLFVLVLVAFYTWGAWVFYSAVMRPTAGDPNISEIRRLVVASLVGILWPIAVGISGTIWIVEHL